MMYIVYTFGLKFQTSGQRMKIPNIYTHFRLNNDRRLRSGIVVILHIIMTSEINVHIWRGIYQQVKCKIVVVRDIVLVGKSITNCRNLCYIIYTNDTV